MTNTNIDTLILVGALAGAVLTILRVVIGIRRFAKKVEEGLAVAHRIISTLDEETRPNGGTSTKDLLTCIADQAKLNHTLLVEIKELLREGTKHLA